MRINNQAPGQKDSILKSQLGIFLFVVFLGFFLSSSWDERQSFLLFFL